MLLNKKTRIVWGLFLIAAMLSGRQGAGWALDVVQQQESGAIAHVDVKKQETPSPKISLEEKLKQIVDLDYQGADVLGVIRSLAWAYGLNVVTGADVKGKVTLSLKEVPLKDALDAIFSVNNLIYSIRGDMLYISKGDSDSSDMESEVIFLKYIPAVQAQAVMTKIISSKGDFKINESANSIIITDFPVNILKVKKILSRIDIAPQQVLIEAKLVDVTLSNLDALGVQWAATYSPGKGIFGRETLSSEKLSGAVFLPEQSTDLAGEQIKITSLQLKGLTVTATLDALVKNGKASILASPSIAVVNGQEARIVIGERYPYKERTQTPTGTTETVKFVDIGVTLRATPHINEDGYITIALHPEVSSLQDAMDAGPRITTREADTTVRIKEGETLIIGGLIKHSEDIVMEKVPVLGSIPVLNFMFKRNARKHEQKELAVFITPKILYSEEEKIRMGDKFTPAVNEKIAVDNLVERAYDRAVDLDKGIAVMDDKTAADAQKGQALSFYEEIYSKYPENLRSAEALYRAGMIYYQDLKDDAKARAIFEQLLERYPKSDFADQAKITYEKIKFFTGLNVPRVMNLSEIQFLNNKGK